MHLNVFLLNQTQTFGRIQSFSRVFFSFLFNVGGCSGKSWVLWKTGQLLGPFYKVLTQGGGSLGSDYVKSLKRERA